MSKQELRLTYSAYYYDYYVDSHNFFFSFKHLVQYYSSSKGEVFFV